MTKSIDFHKICYHNIHVVLELIGNIMKPLANTGCRRQSKVLFQRCARMIADITFLNGTDWCPTPFEIRCTLKSKRPVVWIILAQVQIDSLGRHLSSWKFRKIQDDFDADGRLDSIAPEARSNSNRPSASKSSRIFPKYSWRKMSTKAVDLNLRQNDPNDWTLARRHRLTLSLRQASRFPERRRTYYRQYIFDVPSRSLENSADASSRRCWPRDWSCTCRARWNRAPEKHQFITMLLYSAWSRVRTASPTYALSWATLRTRFAYVVWLS